MLLRFALLLAFLKPSNAKPIISIGVMLPDGISRDVSKAVGVAVEFANRNILINSSLNVTSIINAHGNQIQQSCKLISEGIFAQIGPEDDAAIHSIAPIFDRIHVPLLVTTSSRVWEKFQYAIPVAPSDAKRSAAVASILQKMSWTAFHILSSGDEHHTSNLIRLMEIASIRSWRIVTSQFYPSIESNMTSQLELIKYSGCRVIVLNCIESQARLVLRNAKTQLLTGIGWVWIIADLRNINNFFGQDPVLDHIQGLIAVGSSLPTHTLAPAFDAKWLTLNPNIPISSISRWADAVFVLAYAVRYYIGINITHNKLNCHSSMPWSMGSSVLNSINEVRQSGPFQAFNFADKYPTKSKYDVYNSRNIGWLKVGTWDPDQGYQMVIGESIELPGKLPASPGYTGAINGQHFQIVTVAEEPFFFHSAGSEPMDKMNMKAGIEIIGYGVDMLLEISNILNFTFTLYMVHDGNWGGKNETSGEWNGLMKELVGNKADFAFATFTISDVRARAIDFSTPYIDVGLGIALPKDDSSVNKFQFITPFHHHVWYAIIATIFIIGVEIAFLEKISPYGHHGEIVHSHWLNSSSVPNKKNTMITKQKIQALTIMRFDNALWYSLATFIQQGYGTYPQAFSSRILSLFWFLSVSGIITMYTAQLGAISIKSHLQGQINNVADLYGQDRIQYGTDLNGATDQFLCESKIALYKNMCRKMIKWNSWTKTDEAITRLADPENLWAFITDSPVVDSIVQKKPCNLRVLGEIFNRGGFGIGLQKNSPYTRTVSQVILQLRENAFLDNLYTKWFTDRTECAQESKIQSDTEKNRKKFSDMEGVFYVILLALSISPMILITEFTYSCIQLATVREIEKAPNRLRMIFKYRINRILRDLKIYMIPKTVKRYFGIDEFLVQEQYEIAHEQSITKH